MKSHKSARESGPIIGAAGAVLDTYRIEAAKAEAAAEAYWRAQAKDRTKLEAEQPRAQMGEVDQASRTGHLVKTIVDVETVDVAAMDAVERIKAGKIEAAARKAWKQAGSVGDAPATPVLDWMADPLKPKAKKANGARAGKYDETTTADLIERITDARGNGVSFPRLAVQMNDSEYKGRNDWTGPKLYAFAQRHQIADLPLVKSVPAD